MVETFSFNYTFWLNVLAAVAVALFAYLNGKHRADMIGHHRHAALVDRDTHDHGVAAGQTP